MQGMHITCRAEHVLPLVKELEAQFAPQAEEVTLLDWGWSLKQHTGYVVLEWLDEVDEAFVAQLQEDTHIEDVCVYTIPDLTDEQVARLEVQALNASWKAEETFHTVC